MPAASEEYRREWDGANEPRWLVLTKTPSERILLRVRNTTDSPMHVWVEGTDAVDGDEFADAVPVSPDRGDGPLGSVTIDTETLQEFHLDSLHEWFRICFGPERYAEGTVVARVVRTTLADGSRDSV